MNIYEVAKEAEVSIATVSRVINKKGNVRPETAARVLSVLEKYNYRPNASAVAMVTQQSMSIAIITVDIRIPHYANTIYVVERFFSAEHYHVLVCNTGGSLESTRQTIEIVTAKKVDGIIFVGSVFNTLCKDEEIIRALEGIPVVLANGFLEWEMASSVLANDGLGIAMCTSHLIERGARKICYVKDLDTDSARNKAAYYKMAMEASGLRPEILEIDFGFAEGMHFAAERLSDLHRIDAFVFGEDMTAAGAVKIWRHQGIRVGEDLLVTAFNNTLESQISEPPLTTVDNKGTKVATECAELLLEILNKKEKPATREVFPDLILRESSEGAKAGAAAKLPSLFTEEKRISGKAWHQEHPEYPTAIVKNAANPAPQKLPDKQ